LQLGGPKGARLPNSTAASLLQSANHGVEWTRVYSCACAWQSPRSWKIGMGLVAGGAAFFPVAVLGLPHMYANSKGRLTGFQENDFARGELSYRLLTSTESAMVRAGLYPARIGSKLCQSSEHLQPSAISVRIRHVGDRGMLWLLRGVLFWE
jgi:hypothetical protein